MVFFLYILASLLILNANAQVDTNFCNPQSPPGDNPKFPIGSLEQYQLIMEVNSGLTKRTSEVEQFYDGKNERGVMIVREKDKEFSIYTDDKVNEVYLVSGDFCEVLKANETMIGGFESLVINGVEQIIPPIIALHIQNPDMKEIFIGLDNIRGIDVVNWQACLFDTKLQATKRITYSLSNPLTWTPAVTITNPATVPVQFRIDGKFKSNGSEWTDINVVTKFRPGVLVNDEFWLTPRGVHCPRRAKGKDTPKTFDAFSFRSKIVTPIPDLDNFFGTVGNLREAYDYKNKLSRFDYSIKNTAFGEIHDFNRGLRFLIDKFRGNCTITTLSDGFIDSEYNGNYLQMKNSSSFFDFDSVNYHFTGRRLVNNIHCDVWLGKRLTPQNETQFLEWYFMADGWSEQSNLQIESHIPVLLTIYNFIPYFNNITQQKDYTKAPIHFYITEYDYSGFEILEYDVGRCFDGTNKRHLIFTLPRLSREDREILKDNKITLRLGILVALQANTALEYLRISHLEIDFELEEIAVIVTVLDKAPFYGSVTMPVPEISLDDAIALLNGTINAGKMVIPFEGENLILKLEIPKNSLKLVGERAQNRTVFLNSTSTSTDGLHSSGEVAGIAIGLLIVGLVIASAISVFFCIYRPNYLGALPTTITNVIGFSNPNHDSTA